MTQAPIKATINVTLARWQTPNFARRAGPPAAPEDGREDVGIPVRELSDEALDALAWAWVSDLYTKAGRRRVEWATDPAIIPKSARP